MLQSQEDDTPNIDTHKHTWQYQTHRISHIMFFLTNANTICIIREIYTKFTLIIRQVSQRHTMSKLHNYSFIDKLLLYFSKKNSKWVWSGNTTITNCIQPRGTARDIYVKLSTLDTTVLSAKSDSDPQCSLSGFALLISSVNSLKECAH